VTAGGEFSGSVCAKPGSKKPSISAAILPDAARMMLSGTGVRGL
jgi:hypothetical protein